MSFAVKSGCHIFLLEYLYKRIIPSPPSKQNAAFSQKFTDRVTPKVTSADMRTQKKSFHDTSAVYLYVNVTETTS